MSNAELAKRLAFVSSLQVGDAQSVLVQLPDIIADYLASGRTVNIKGLGNFFPSITSEPVERIEDCTADKVRISRICFRAAGSFMQRVCRHLDLFSFQVQELKKELKKKYTVLLVSFLKQRVPLEAGRHSRGTLLKKLCVSL